MPTFRKYGALAGAGAMLILGVLIGDFPRLLLWGVAAILGAIWIFSVDAVSSRCAKANERLLRFGVGRPVMSFLCVAIAGAVLGFVLIGGSWLYVVRRHKTIPVPVQEVLEINAYIAPQGSPYPAGMLIGGIPWDSKYVDVRLDITIGSRSIRNLDVWVGLDTSIAAMGQISQFPNIVVFPDDPKGPPAIWLEGKDEHGKPVNTPSLPAQGPGGIAPAYRLQCSELYHDTTLRLVIASVATNPSPKGELPPTPYAPTRTPTRLNVVGTYEGGDKTQYPVNYEVRLTSNGQR